MEYKKLTKSLVLVSALFISNMLHATVLTGGLNVDNAFTAYISTDSSTAGTQIGWGDNWGITSQLNATTLNNGQDYFLQIMANDIGGIAGFLGDFSLDGPDHTFANGSNFITTNTTDWMVSTTGWSSYAEVTGLGFNSAEPWGYRNGVVEDAEWIWSSDAYNDNLVYFSLAINATNSASVPEPSIIALLGLGIFGIALSRRRII